MPNNIKSEVVKKIYGQNWRFQTLESGWIALSAISYDKKNNVKWQRQITTVDIASCLQYIFLDNNSKGEVLIWEDLETV